MNIGNAIARSAETGRQRPEGFGRCHTIAASPSEAIHATPDADGETIEDRIKSARLAQLSLANAKATEEARGRSGFYMETASARREIGRVAIKFIGLFEAALPEFADALSVKVQLPSREILDAMRETWRQIRVREANRERLAAKNEEGDYK
jgi:hypothetical protein